MVICHSSCLGLVKLFPFQDNLQSLNNTLIVPNPLDNVEILYLNVPWVITYLEPLNPESKKSQKQSGLFSILLVFAHASSLNDLFSYLCLVHHVGATVRVIVIINLLILHSKHLLFKFQLDLSQKVTLRSKYNLSNPNVFHMMYFHQY